MMGAKASKTKQQSPPKEFKLLVWNVQGLREDFLEERCSAILNIIEAKKPKAIMFQELVPSTYSLFQSHLTQEYSHYSPFNFRDIKPQYFTGIFLETSTFGSAEPKFFRFPHSTQGRDSLIINVPFKTSGVTFITSHLESMLNRREERKKQLGLLYQTMMNQPKKHTVIYGGDTNLLDLEFDDVVKSGNFDVSEVGDAWNILGSPENLRYTWDPIKNDNETVSDAEFSKKRLDRVFVRSAAECQVPSYRPADMEFVGMDRLPKPCEMFPSDHWGLLIKFSTKSH